MTQDLDQLNANRVAITGSVAYSGDAVANALDAASAVARSTGSSFRVLTGTASGADELARSWAKANEVNLYAENLELGTYPEPMHAYNQRLLAMSPDLVLAFKDNFDHNWKDPSVVAGTEHLCRIAAEADVAVLLNNDTWLHAPKADALPQPGHAAAVFGKGLVVVKGDITKLTVDVIVNAANSSLLGGGGVDGAIHRAAGPTLLDECRDAVARQGGCRTGDAVITGAGELPASHVVHTVGPVWNGQPDPLLGECYRKSLDLADNRQAHSIAFPNISTGVYGYPKDLACSTAVETVREWLDGNPGTTIETVVFCCFDDTNTTMYRSAVDTPS